MNTAKLEAKLAQVEREHADESVRLGDLRRDYDQLAATALIEDMQTPPAPKALDACEAKVRALHAAVVRLTADLQSAKDAERSGELAKIRERLAVLHRDRQKAVDLAVALQHVAHRIFAASIGSAVAGGSFSPRISGMADINDWPRPQLPPALKEITASLIALGVPHSEATKEAAASEHLAAVQRAESRQLSAAVVDLLKRADLLSVELEPLKP